MLKFNLRKFPFLSTLFAAIVLAAFWMTSWLLVFFGSTWGLGLETGTNAFVFAFWLSVAAETVIRGIENSDFIAVLSKPFDDYPIGDNQDYKTPYAVSLLMIQLLFMASYVFLSEQIPNWFGIGNAVFHGQNILNSSGFIQMLENWWQGLSTNSVSMSLMVGFLFRVVIYKRNHKNSVWVAQKREKEKYQKNNTSSL